MKKRYLPLLLCISILLTSLLSVASYAESANGTLTPIWSETFDDTTKYSSNTKYNATVADGVLTLNAKTNDVRGPYQLSGDDDELSGKTKLTFAVTFKVVSAAKNTAVFASYGHSTDKAYYSGFQHLTNAVLAHGSTSNTTMIPTHRYLTTPETKGTDNEEKVPFPISETGVMIVEVDENQSSVCTLYIDGVKVGIAASSLRSGDKYQQYDASTDTEKTMNGHFGLIIPFTAAKVSIGTYSIYDGVGLDHDAIMEQAYDPADFADFSIAQANLNLGQTINVNYYATVGSSVPASDVSMRFTMNDKVKTVSGTATENEAEYMFTYDGLSPQCMGDSIKAELLWKNKVLATSDTFTVRGYCDTLLEDYSADTSEKAASMRTLIADLLEYGAQAQLYRGYKTDALVNSGITPSEYTQLDASVAKLLGTSTNEDTKFIGAGVYFGNVNKLYFHFTASDITDDNFAVRITPAGGTPEIYGLSELEGVGADTYRVFSSAISAIGFDTRYTVELCTVSGEEYTVIQTLDYSIASYVYSTQDGTDTMSALARALYNYGRASAEYAKY